MSYPSLIEYITVFANISEHLLPLEHVRFKGSGHGDAQYTLERGVVWFDVSDSENRALSVGVFLSHKARNRFSPSASEKIIPKVLIFQDALLDIVLKQNWVGNKPPKPSSVNTAIEPSQRAIELYQDPATGLWGFINNLSLESHKAQWDSIEEFSEGRAVVKKGGLYGLVSSHGEVVIECEYDELSWDGSQYAYVDLMGEWGVLSREGEIISKPQWEWIGEFSHGFAVVSSGGKYGYIDSKGELVIETKYDQANSFSEYGSAYVRLGSEKFHIDSKQRRM